MLNTRRDEMFRKLLDEGPAGDNMGVLLQLLEERQQEAAQKQKTARSGKETSRDQKTMRPGKESRWEEAFRSGEYFQAERPPYSKIYTVRHRRAVAGMCYSKRRKLWEKQTATTASKRTWRNLKAAIAEGQYRCSYCWRTAEGVDHIIPLSRGGTHREGNWAPACTPCNRSKGKMFLIEWRQKRLGEGTEDDEEH